MAVFVTGGGWPGHPDTELGYELSLPVKITLPDGIIFELDMIDESEVGFFIKEAGHPDECLWSKDYAISNQEENSAEEAGEKEGAAEIQTEVVQGGTPTEQGA